jgi:hypothetical protein
MTQEMLTVESKEGFNALLMLLLRMCFRELLDVMLHALQMWVSDGRVIMSVSTTMSITMVRVFGFFKTLAMR